MARTKLSDEQIAGGLSGLPGWSYQNGQITKAYDFESYATGLAFASTVGFMADKLDHHPDLFIGYRKVRVSLNTHDVDGISELDFELAGRIELL